MTSLRRTRASDFHIADSLSLDSLIASADDDSWTHYLLKPDHVLQKLLSVTLDDAETVAFLHGRMIEMNFANWEKEENRIRVYGKSGNLVGLARVDDESNFIHPEIVFGDSTGN